MSTLEVGQKLVEFSNAGRSDSALDQLYGDTIVSVEGDATATEGIAGVRGKHEWWDANHEVHSAVAEGPYCGARQDQFVVKFTIDLTPISETRQQFSELGIYTVDAGRIVREEFLPLQSA